MIYVETQAHAAEPPTTGNGPHQHQLTELHPASYPRTPTPSATTPTTNLTTQPPSPTTEKPTLGIP